VISLTVRTAWLTPAVTIILMWRDNASANFLSKVGKDIKSIAIPEKNKKIIADSVTKSS